MYLKKLVLGAAVAVILTMTASPAGAARACGITGEPGPCPPACVINGTC